MTAGLVDRFDENVDAAVFVRLIRAGADLAELFFEDTTVTKLRRHNERVTEVASGHRIGVGIRVVVDGRQYLAHTNDLSPLGVAEAAESLVGTWNDRGHRPPLAGSPRARRTDQSSKTSASVASRAACLAIVDAAMTGAHEAGSVDDVGIDFDTTLRSIRTLNSDGLDERDTTMRTEVTVDCTIRASDRIDNGRRNRGDAVGPDDFSLDDASLLGTQAAEQALTRAAARPAPTGTMDVVVAAGTAGVIFHETVGHGLEIDIVESFRSVYRDRLNEPIAGPLLTVIDDGGMPGAWGSASIDDEGTPTGETVLVEGGVLMSYLHDRVTGSKYGGTPTGNSRRATYADLPYVRMTNTVVRQGNTDPAAIIGDTRSGIYVAHLRGGSFNPGTGDFLFSTSEASLIENGRVTAPIRNATIIGSARDALHRVDALGNDFAMVAGGRCGKRSQELPVGFGSPTVRLRALTIGGT